MGYDAKAVAALLDLAIARLAILRELGLRPGAMRDPGVRAALESYRATSRSVCDESTERRANSETARLRALE